jgi:type IV pilus assembly protein PilC
MAVFVWKGKNRYGDLVRGERAANSSEEVARALKREQIAAISIGPKSAGLSLPHFKREKVKLKDLSVYSRQLSVLIDAEMPLIQSLNILSEQATSRYFKKVISSVREDVEAGSSLNQAKRKFPKVFDDLYCNLIASGEQSGSLDTMLQRLAEYIERSVKLRGQVRQAMIYPSAIMSFALVVAIFMLWKVIPIFGGIFTDLGAQLPGLTQGVIVLSHFVTNYILFIILGLIVAFFLFRYYRKTPQGRLTTDRIALRLPIMGKLASKVAISRVVRTLSTLLSGGVSMLEALRITSSTSGNSIIEKSVVDVRKQVAEGRSLTDAFKSTGRFPFMMCQMVNVGEATGKLDSLLNKLADFYDEEVSATVGSLLSLLEPVMMVFVGGIVGTLVLSMYLPIFSLMGQIQ